MVIFGGLLLVLVRLELVLTEPRTASDRVVEVVERGVSDGSDMRLQQSERKLFHRRHHTRHRLRGVVPPEAEVRCYCNLPACVTTGYMCQSMVGSCFSETTETAGRSHTQHGCLELISRHKQHICERLHSENKSDLRLRCCTSDMCNLMDDVDFDVQVANTQSNTARPAPTPPSELLNINGRQGSRSGELWLRAATIAVPIAGLFILCVLVLLAVRLLRRESKPPPYHYAKAPLCALDSAAGCEAPPAPSPALPTGRLLAPPTPEARVDVHRTVCCVYAADPRCPHAAAAAAASGGGV